MFTSDEYVALNSQKPNNFPSVALLVISSKDEPFN